MSSKVEELLKKDTSGMSLSEMIDACGEDVLKDPKAVYRLRRRHEDDTGIPMEEDDFGVGEANLCEETFGSILKKLKSA